MIGHGRPILASQMTRQRFAQRKLASQVQHGSDEISRKPSIGPAQLTMATDSGSRERAALTLQATAGNRAVAASVADIARVHAAQPSLAVVGSPASTVAPAPGGVTQIGGQAVHAAGVTSLPAPGAPDVVIGAPLQQSDGQWQATVQSTSVTPDTPTSLFPGAGLHDEAPTATGMVVHRHVTAAASDEIRRGEEEHLLDLEWARDLAYDRVADAVNRVAGSGPATGATAEAARRAALQQIRSAVPGQARWPDGVDPIMHWRRIYGQLVAITRERDSPNRWHNINTEIVMDEAAKRRLGVPVADELLRYIAGTTQVGQHPSGPLVQARYNSLPLGPAGTPTPANQGPTSTQVPPDAISPAGDYEPGDEAYAIRAMRARA
jgi:hypothetical protein